RLAAERAETEQAHAAALARQPEEEEAARTAEAEATGADRALGTALEAHAALLAEARSARATLEAARTRAERLARETERQATELERLRSGGAARGAEAQVADAESALAAESERVRTAATEVDGAESAARAASAARASVERTLAAARAELAALEAERKALDRIGAGNRPSGRVAIAVEAGFEQAAAAAFGEDLDAELGAAQSSARPARRWAGAPAPTNDPPLPKGVVPLAPHVEAPAELARRLAQVGLVEGPPDAARLASLAPGQRLVSRDGWMWRWEGFVAPPGGRAAAVAEGLAMANRRRALERALEPPRARASAAEAELKAQDTALRQAQAAERDARGRRTTAEQARERLAGRLQGLRAALSEARARESALEAALERLAAERSAAAAEVEAAEAGVATLPDPSSSAQEVATARTTAERARAALSAVRATAAATARSVSEAGARIAALDREIAGWEARDTASTATLAALAARIESLVAERAALVAEPAAHDSRAAALAAEIARAEAAREDARQALQASEIALADLDRQARAAEARVADLRETRAGAAARAEQAGETATALATESAGRFGCHPRDLAPATPEPAQELEARLTRLLAERERLGVVNLRADIELAELEETLGRQGAEKADLETACARLRGTIGALNREGRARLTAAFAAVDAHFRTLFATLFDGGQAELSLVDSEDPLEAGLEIRAQPPGKRLQSLSLLSGGEQALTAIALIFALFLTNPAPICVLDEVDAPLDDANVERFCALLQDMTGRCETRFLIVTHNAVTMSRMDRLYGVTMAEPGISRLVSVDLRAAETLLAA
ncbi:MAG: chromosome segregation protein, partial [Thermaurantiacus sp.]